MTVDMEAIGKPEEKRKFIREMRFPASRNSSFEGPPSPTTSGYSELDSEPDAHDSGRVSELESSPKTSTRSSKRPLRNSRSSTTSSPAQQEVVVDRGVLRALLVYVRETRIRLEENETKMKDMKTTMETQERNFNERMLTVVKSLVSINTNSKQKIDRGTQLYASPERPVKLTELDVLITDSRKDDVRDDVTPTAKLASSESADTVTGDSSTLSIQLDTDMEKENNKPEEEPKVQPVYAVVKKKKKPSTSACVDASDDSAAASSHDDGGSFPESPPMTQQCNSDSNSSAVNTHKISVQAEQNENTSNDTTKLGPKKARPQSESVLDAPDRSELIHRPFSSDALHEAKSEELLDRYSADGFYICPRRPISESTEDSSVSAKDDSPRKRASSNIAKKIGKDLKSGMLVSKFKRKLYDRKNQKNNRNENACTEISSPSFYKPSPQIDECTELESNNNNLPNEMVLKQPKSFLSYTNRAESQLPYRYQLDSTGTNTDSRRSTDTSDGRNSQVGRNKYETIDIVNQDHIDPTYESVEFKPRPELIRPPYQIPLKDPDNARVPKGPRGPGSPRVPRAPLSTSSSRPSSSSSCSSTEGEVKLPQTVKNELYHPTEIKTTVVSGYCHCYKQNEVGSPKFRLTDDVFVTDGIILDDVTHQQDELRRLESGGVAAQWHGADEPPPKPSRPGFPGSQGARGYPPQPGSQGPLYQPTNQGYLGGRPAIPPKSVPRIMTAEELANHEAQEKLRQRQFEDSKLEEKLMIQKKQAEADKLWLQQEEEQLKPERTPSNGDLDEQDPDHLYQSADEVRQRREASAGRNAADSAPPPPSMPPAKPPRNPPIKDVQVAQPRPPTFEEVKPTPTMKLDREGDAVYRDTMLVVKAVLQANQEVMAAKPDEIFVLVKNIGKALKELCTSLDHETPNLPSEYHREIDMAQKTTNKDLSQVINQMKLVKRFYSTTQVTDYKKCMMAATQVLAMDAKNLLDVVDKSRLQALAGASNGHATSNLEEPNSESAGLDHTLPPPPSELLHDA
ncbi:uncharacterized protein LOC144745014 [Ciona intestinalis]